MDLGGQNYCNHTILPDEPAQIRSLLQTLTQRSDVDAILFNGGTGIAPRIQLTTRSNSF
jgi:molybdenum cofactor biosynthesis protein B